MVVRALTQSTHEVPRDKKKDICEKRGEPWKVFIEVLFGSVCYLYLTPKKKTDFGVFIKF